jgi:LacI family transcriptional regulator, repressor for deo operon, udp, cdd, tsx, nupC, and nupG
MTATIVDVARRADVSIATVSRVIHGSPQVSDETRRRVEQVMAELSYAPNVVARGLVTRRTQAIGLVITSMADPFFPPIVQGVEETALDHGYSVLLSTSGNDPARELAVVRLLRERRVDAIIVASSRVGDLYQSHLEEIKVPLVLINNEQSGAYAHTVGTDDVTGGRLAARYLLRLGHRRIAYIHGPSVKQSTHDRYRGYEFALCEMGVAVDPALVVSGDGQADGGRQAMQGLLQVKPRPTAVFCFNDLTALGALRAVRSAGLAVPADVSVVGYDDIDLAAYAEPPLTTIAQQSHELGRRAMLLALDLLSGKPAASLTLPATLVERASCAPVS